MISEKNTIVLDRVVLIMQLFSSFLNPSMTDKRMWLVCFHGLVMGLQLELNLIEMLPCGMSFVSYLIPAAGNLILFH